MCASRALPLLFSFALAVFGQETVRPRDVREVARGGAAAVPKLRQFLKNPDIEVRVEAVREIIEIGSVPAALDALLDATADNDPEVQARATDGLVNFYLPGYVRTGFAASLRRAGGTLKGKFTDTNDQVVDAYPMPSHIKGKFMPTFLGGSDLAVPVTTKNQSLAVDWIKAFTSTAAESEIAKAGNIANTTKLLAFNASNPNYRAGSTGWGILRGPGYWSINPAIYKNFKFRERVNAEFRAESTNFSNTPQFSNPSGSSANMRLNPDGTLNTSLSDPLQNFMCITGTNAAGRQFRFGLRLSF
jgi:hypothetical protein